MGHREAAVQSIVTGMMVMLAGAPHRRLSRRLLLVTSFLSSRKALRE